MADLSSGFLSSLQLHPERPALSVDGAEYSYAQLADRAARIAAILTDVPGDGPPLTAVLARRSLTSYSGVLATLIHGHGYVPLNPSFPPARTAEMLDRSQCRAVIVDRGAQAVLEAIFPLLSRPLVVVLPDHEDAGWVPAPHRAVVGLEPAELRPRSAKADDIAYLLFTSGSTGRPKGVMVAHRNVESFLEAAVARYGYGPQDRLSQLFELVFDLSVFDLFAAWKAGACVCAASPSDLIFPAAYIARERLTSWFSVPSLALMMQKVRMLRPGFYPDLRWALFCGEALPADVAIAFRSAAPNAIVENLYGPTEVTIACTTYRWDDAMSPSQCRDGVVPIGEPFPGNRFRVVDPELREVAPGETGELCMAGEQVSLGYWRDPERTDNAFVRMHDGMYYRTGDRVVRPDGDEPLRYLGRIDQQVQVQGHRVELGEIEAVVRTEAGVSAVVALGWPLTVAGAEAIVVIVEAEVDGAALLAACKTRLPSYMVPREIRRVSPLPLNSNGKIDRAALLRGLEG